MRYLQEELSMKEDILHKEDINFQKAVRKVLEENPELNDLFENKNKPIKQEHVNSEEDSNVTDDASSNDNGDDNSTGVDDNNDNDKSEKEVTEIENKPKQSKDPELKSLYRKIVKLTHPDRIDNEELVSLYKEATDYYDSNDIMSIYDICEKLDIEYERPEGYDKEIEKKINNLQNKLNNVESSYTWIWYTSETDEKKIDIINNFINQKIKKV